MTTRIYQGSQRVDAINTRDRGLAYGDGLFETILIHHGAPVWLDAHLQRLQHGCAILRIASLDPDFLRGEIAALAAHAQGGVLKLILTRGIGERGYAPPTNARPTIAMTLSAAPFALPRDGLHLRWCETPLAIQPMLAGIKHLNRLEQVMARSEWTDTSIHEGLQCDTSGRVVCATSANLFALLDGRWLTPPVAHCGVAGVCRAWILDTIDQAQEGVLTRDEVESADSLILCNAVRGILCVAALGSRRWSPHPQAKALQEQLAAAVPAFEHTQQSPDSMEDA